MAAHPLSKRKFKKLLGDMDSMHVGLLMYNNVRWLSRGKVLERFVECLDEIIIFLTTEKIIEKFKGLFDSQWILKLIFFTDLCLHVNELNTGLQGRNKTIIIMFDLIKAFEAKLRVSIGMLIQKLSSILKTQRNIFTT